MFGTDYDQNHGLDNKDFPEWVAKKISHTFYNFCYPLYSNDNIICSKKNELRLKFQNKDILLLAGGGSTLRFLDTVELTNFHQPWSKMSKWTLNNFFKNSTIARHTFDLVSLGPEVDLKDWYLNEYLNFYDTLVGIELHQKWSRENEDSELIKEVNTELNNHYKFCFQTRYFSVLGSGARLIILACELGVKSVSFIGFDGPEAIWEADHAFEKGKNFMTYRCQGYPKEQVIQMFKDEYSYFWNYIKTTYPNTEIISIDKNNKYHEILKNIYA